jgi:hypothetical protein
VRLRISVLAVAFAAAAAPANANAALAFLFDRSSAAPNDVVLARAGGTPRRFRPEKPLSQPIRLYLLPNDLVDEVHSRFDRRLAFIGSVRLDRRGRGALSFSVPPLDAGDYAIALWCPSCATYSRGRTFFVQDVSDFVEPYRSQALLQIATKQTCPVTIPNGKNPPGDPGRHWHGNGLLWAGLAPDGVLAIGGQQVEADGSLFEKLLWSTTPADDAPTISGRRLDVPGPPLRVLATYFGSFSTATRPSWMSPVLFPSTGCWRITARVRDVSLTYVTKVVVG